MKYVKKEYKSVHIIYDSYIYIYIGCILIRNQEMKGIVRMGEMLQFRVDLPQNIIFL